LWSRFSSPRKAVESQSFLWYIKVAEEEGLIDSALASKIDGLRKIRNTVHITERAKVNHKYSLGASNDAYQAMQLAINQSKSWWDKNK